MEIQRPQRHVQAQQLPKSLFVQLKEGAQSPGPQAPTPAHLWFSHGLHTKLCLLLSQTEPWKKHTPGPNTPAAPERPRPLF